MNKIQIKHFMFSFAIFLFLWFPLVILSLPIIFLMLLTKWEGKTTWFGNYLYGRMGNTHTPTNPNILEQWWFLAIRNPVSNFGKFILSVGPDSTKWLERLEGKYIGVLYGWKNPDSRLPGNRRPFVFRPYKIK